MVDLTLPLPCKSWRESCQVVVAVYWCLLDPTRCVLVRLVVFALVPALVPEQLLIQVLVLVLARIQILRLLVAHLVTLCWVEEMIELRVDGWRMYS